VTLKNIHQFFREINDSQIKYCAGFEQDFQGVKSPKEFYDHLTNLQVSFFKAVKYFINL
jgi:hypothetical protein